jgi:uncharacterized membrane protein
MKTNSELKNRAIDALTGNWGLGAVITLVYGLVMNAPTLPYRIMESVASSSFSLIALLLLPLGFGYTVLFLDVIRGIKLDFARLFDGFKDYGRILGTMLLTTKSKAIAFISMIQKYYQWIEFVSTIRL